MQKGGYLILTISNVTGERYIQQEGNTISTLPNDIQEHQVLKENDILISLTGNVGRVSLNNGSNHLLNQRVGLFQLADEQYREYIYQVLATPQFEKSMINKGQGAAQMNIGKSDVEDFEIPFDENVQDKLLDITNLLYLLDTKLICEQTIFHKMQEQKQFLLQQMFI